MFSILGSVFLPASLAIIFICVTSVNIIFMGIIPIGIIFIGIIFIGIISIGALIGCMGSISFVIIVGISFSFLRVDDIFGKQSGIA